MKYLAAIISTITLVLIPMIMLPVLQWYKREFLEPNTNLEGIYMILILVGLFQILLCAFIVGISS